MSTIQNLQDHIGQLQSALGERNTEIAKLRKELSERNAELAKLDVELKALREQQTAKQAA
jgi:uncharacterized coiled-coil DUF342 family protein